MSAALPAAAAAPSVHNTQPWLLPVTATAVEVLADRSRRLAVLDPGGREMLIGVGAAVFNLRGALGAAGHRAVVAHAGQRRTGSRRPGVTRHGGPTVGSGTCAGRGDLGPAHQPSPARASSAGR